MAKSLKLEVPEESLRAMRQAAKRSGLTLEEWAVRQLRRCAPTKQEQELALAQLLKQTLHAPDAVGTDEESINRDLAREYAGEHG